VKTEDRPASSLVCP